jgi:hypothetical protein
MKKAIVNVALVVVVAVAGTGCGAVGGQAEPFGPNELDSCTLYDDDGIITAECVVSEHVAMREAAVGMAPAFPSARDLQPGENIDLERPPHAGVIDPELACEEELCGDFGCLCLSRAEIQGDELVCTYVQCLKAENPPAGTAEQPPYELR